MKNKNILYVILNTLIWTVVAAKRTQKDEEIGAKLQFFEYDLEDFCVSKNEAEWNFLNGSSPDLQKLLEIELKESEYYKNELISLQKFIGTRKFSNEKLQRLVDIFSFPGASLLDSMEFKEYRDYSIKLQELLGKMEIQYANSSDFNTSNIKTKGKSTSLNYRDVNKILFAENSEKKLTDVWIKWYKKLEEKNKKTKYDFVQQLSILDLEAEQNGEDELTEYWLKQSDSTSMNFETLEKFWREIQPLYEKLKNHLLSFIDQNLKKNSLHNQKLIQIQFLGSLESYDWVTAAEKWKVFESFDAYKDLKSFLTKSNAYDLYKLADNLTRNLKLDFLPHNFYEKSSFNESSRTCKHKKMDYCERNNPIRVMFCEDEIIDLKQFLTINENVMKIKYLTLSGKEEEENGFLFREGPRESVLYEAMAMFSSLNALLPKNLESQKIVSETKQTQLEILSALIMALHVIVPLPYYLASDLWRIKALQEIDAAVGETTVDSTILPPVISTPETALTTKQKTVNYNGEDSVNINNFNETYSNYTINSELNNTTKTYDNQNLTKDWWNFRKKYQGVIPPDGKLYEDYLQDINIIWNKPYISKFLGTILLFQIAEYFKSPNFTADSFLLQNLMIKGKSKPWQVIAEEIFQITNVSTEPLLNYFKPLEEFLDKNKNLKNHSQIFDFDNFNFISQGFSLNSATNDEVEKPAEGSDALFFTLAVLAAVAVVAVIVTVGRRRYKKKQRTKQRKRRLANL